MSDLQAVQENPANQAQVVNAEIVSKPQKRKYDMRGKYDRSHLKNVGKSKPGPKSHEMQRFGRTAAVRLIRTYEAIASLSQIYSMAFERGDLKLLFEMRVDANNRAFGRPFQATDPNAVAKPNVLHDERMQFAINELHVDTPRLKP